MGLKTHTGVTCVAMDTEAGEIEALNVVLAVGHTPVALTLEEVWQKKMKTEPEVIKTKYLPAGTAQFRAIVKMIAARGKGTTSRAQPPTAPPTGQSPNKLQLLKNNKKLKAPSRFFSKGRR